MSDFYKYFKENMHDQGLTAPDSLFGSQQAATGTISTILAFTDKHGTRVTVSELAGAGTKMERLAAVGRFPQLSTPGPLSAALRLRLAGPSLGERPWPTCCSKLPSET